MMLISFGRLLRSTQIWHQLILWRYDILDDLVGLIIDICLMCQYNGVCDRRLTDMYPRLGHDRYSYLLSLL
jgi:hypothetical protein